MRTAENRNINNSKKINSNPEATLFSITDLVNLPTT